MKESYIDFENILAGNWDPAFHHTGKPNQMNAYMFGLTVLDWDNTYTKRLRKYGSVDLRIPFQYMENVPVWIKGAQYSEVGDIMGRYEPLNVYSSSSAQEITLNLVYYADARREGPGVLSPWTMTKIEQIVKKLQSSVFPNQSDTFFPPPRFLLNIGNSYKDIPILIRNVTIENLEPFDVLSGISMHRKITLECRVSYPSWQFIDGADVWQAHELGAGFNGNEIFAYEVLDPKYSNGSIFRK